MVGTRTVTDAATETVIARERSTRMMIPRRRSGETCDGSRECRGFNRLERLGLGTHLREVPDVGLRLHPRLSARRALLDERKSEVDEDPHQGAYARRK
jgi:hypothetical protein